MKKHMAQKLAQFKKDMDQEKAAKYVPRLNDYNGDLTRRWYIEYYIWHVGKKEYARKRYRGMNQFKTLKSRYKHCEEAIETLINALKDGYTVGEEIAEPEPEEINIFNLSTFTLQQALTYFVNYKNASLTDYEHHTLQPIYNEGIARISKNTYSNYKTIRNLVLTWLELEKKPDLLLAKFDRKKCDLFFRYLKETLKQSNKTFNKYRGYLSTVINFYVEHQELEIKNVVKKVEHLTNIESEAHAPVSPVHLQKIKHFLIDNNQHQLYLYIGFLYYTFTRPHEEIRLLRIADIRLKTIFIPSKRAKSNRGEHVSITEGLEALIEKYQLRSYPPDYFVFTKDGKPGTEPVGEKYFYRAHIQLLAHLDLDGLKYSLYGYKHTGALELYEMTKDIIAVQKHCRHTSSSQTDTYLRKYGAMLNMQAIGMAKF